MGAAIMFLFCAVALVLCRLSNGQYQPPQQAAILSDARYLAGDGTFGAAYSQEDGVEFKEESDVYGNRRGSYSYVDPTGQRRTVSYTAGKNGFQATGDGIPVPPPQAPPQPEYEPLPQYNPPDYQPPIHNPPAQQPYQRPSAPVYEPQPQPRPVYQPEPQYPYRPRPPPPPPPEIESIPSYNPRSQYQPPARPLPQYNEITTPSPRRFYPPGKLSFNRTPDGYSYTFSKS
ncbi:cuticular protein 19 isoform X4 [Megalopta genalis]|uniref:cuticular protein 19 isoform X1 n=1 Tax=Megalopta genalis TaxID=115081 RepID=UPI0014437C0D|nr:procyclic form-specific polypeptide B1-alpha [Megalopta genalis]